jgi:hypothetical protein
MSRRLEVTVSDEVAERVEVARGDVSRQRWLLRLVERALDAPAPAEKIATSPQRAPTGWVRGPKGHVDPRPKR